MRSSDPASAERQRHWLTVSRRKGVNSFTAARLHRNAFRSDLRLQHNPPGDHSISVVLSAATIFEVGDQDHGVVRRTAGDAEVERKHGISRTRTASSPASWLDWRDISTWKGSCRPEPAPLRERRGYAWAVARGVPAAGRGCSG